MPAWWPMSGLDLVPDAETALKVGRAILDRYYGEEMVRRYEPFRAMLQGEEWWILGSPAVSREHDQSAARVTMGGGFPELSLHKKDARVASVKLV
jgi:NTF2 fold immunity protein